MLTSTTETEQILWAISQFTRQHRKKLPADFVGFYLILMIFTVQLKQGVKMLRKIQMQINIFVFAKKEKLASFFTQIKKSF